MIGKTISHYKVLEKIGAGGMGVVYKAQDTKLDRFVALKFLPLHLNASEEEKQRFIHEAKAASGLQHNNICTIHEIDETDDGQMFICMDYYEGETLKQQVERGQLKVEEAIDIASQVAEGLATAHKQDIVHRDLKPANVMITKDGVVKIVDFGLAKLGGQTKLTKTGTTLGTAAYMSPEQARGEEVDYRTDIWSFGVVLYEMVSGQLPFKGDYEQAMVYSILNEEPEPLKKLQPEIPEELEEIVKRALAKNPDSRFSSVTELLQGLKEYQTALQPPGAGIFTWKPLLQRIRRPSFSIPGILIISILCFFAVRFYNSRSKVQWARYTALPEIARLLEKQSFTDAFRMARQAERYIPDDPQLRKSLQSTSLPVSIRSTPRGADVYFKDYLTVDADWEYFGQSPIEDTRIPASYLRWKIVKEGFESIEWAYSGWLVDVLHFTLDPPGAGPAGMVRVPGGTYQFGDLDAVELQDYWIDKYEVTNKEYKEFVDAGGYQKREYWKQPFIMQGRNLSWEEAIAEFRDTTGRPGPSNWKVGTFSEGRADFPIRGVSWYEAAAYAEFAGKSLPTVYHWYKAATANGTGIFSYVVLLSNFGGEGPVRVGSHPGLGPFGTYDMAGNIKEWCWNQTGSRRYILGGAWSEPEYMFTSDDADMPFDRSETYGFRCMKYTASLPEAVTDPIITSYHDFGKEKPVGDDIFQVYKSFYSYDRTNLNAVIESVDESSEYWRKETITFDAAYGNERIIAHLFLPKNVAAPYQTVIYFPGSYAFRLKSSENLAEMALVDFIPRSGRAFMYPIYKGTYERRSASSAGGPKAWRDQTIQQAKDLGRTIDYLETREDIDNNRLAYFGLSSGASDGPIFTALEERLKVSVLLWGGLYMRKGPPEIEPINPIHFAPRARIPVLMINGRYDLFFPLETSQKPMFRLLGAPEKDKRHAVLDGGHVTPMNEVIKETLNWLDRYLGPVQRQMQSSKK